MTFLPTGQIVREAEVGRSDAGGTLERVAISVVEMIEEYYRHKASACTRHGRTSKCPSAPKGGTASGTGCRDAGHARLPSHRRPTAARRLSPVPDLRRMLSRSRCAVPDERTRCVPLPRLPEPLLSNTETFATGAVGVPRG
jgi:hypothetical protein